MAYIEDQIRAFDGLRLYIRRSKAEDARGEVIIIHGFGEHSGRYGLLTEHLVRNGYSVTSYDQRGHGQSEGLSGHVERFSDYENDLDKVISLTKSQADASRLFLTGHSMGGLVTLRYLARDSSDRVAGAVISAPLLGLAVEAPAYKLLIARISARLAPRMRMNNEIDPMVLSRDSDVGRAYAADPLVHHLVSVGWFAEATRAMQEIKEQAGSIKLPILVMHGTDDKLASIEATRMFFDKIGSDDKELILYKDYYHELFNEPEKEEIYARVTDWLNAHNR